MMRLSNARKPPVNGEGSHLGSRKEGSEALPPTMAPRRSRKAGKMGAGAERRHLRRLENESLLDLMDTCDLTEDDDAWRFDTSRDGRMIKITLENCSMRALPDSIGGLKALTHLDLAECVNLITLPESIAGLTALERLELPNCGALTALPAAIGELKSLTELDLTRCESLAELPATIGGLTALEELVLSGCSITALPDAIVYLKSLWKLDLERCESLTSLPHALDELKDLTELNLAWCSSLTALPPAIQTMPNLNIKGWERPLSSNYVRFLQLARPRVNAEHPELASEVIDGIIGDFWSVVCEARRAKVDDTQDGTTYGEFLVGNLIQVIRRHKRRVCDACGRKGTLEEDRFPVCWCGARRYCGVDCQKADWDEGHAQTCASGHTWSATHLEIFRNLEKLRIATKGNLEYLRKTPSGNPDVDDAALIHNDEERDLATLEEQRQFFIAKNPPPADRER